MVHCEGGFAKYVVMPERNLVSVPDDVSLSIAALADPIACGWHAVRKAEAIIHKKDQDIRAVVTGGGAIGRGANGSRSGRERGGGGGGTCESQCCGDGRELAAAFGSCRAEPRS